MKREQEQRRERKKKELFSVNYKKGKLFTIRAQGYKTF
jgi:hypothetical protein